MFEHFRKPMGLALLRAALGGLLDKNPPTPLPSAFAGSASLRR